MKIKKKRGNFTTRLRKASRKCVKLPTKYVNFFLFGLDRCEVDLFGIKKGDGGKGKTVNDLTTCD